MISINGSTGQITGLAVGGLGAGIVDTATLAAAAVTAPKLSGGQIGTAPVYGLRGFVTFDGATGAILASANITSVVRNSVGVYTVTMTVAMPDTSYVPEVTCTQGATGYIGTVSGQTTTTFVVRVFGQAGTSQDATAVHVALTR